MYACETCPSEYTCGGLATALRVAEAMPDLVDRKDLKAAVDLIREKLHAVGWKFGDSEHMCQLAGKDREIQRLTALLIVELQKSRRQKRDPDTSAPQTLAAEEYHRE